MNSKLKLLSLLILCMFFNNAYGQDQPGTVKFPAGLDSPDSLIRAADNVSSTTAAPVTASATSILLLNTGAFPSSGMGTMGNEKFTWTSKNISSLTGVTRGVGGTTAAAHGVGVAVRVPILSNFHNTLAASQVATQTKVGYGASIPASGKFLKGIGPGQSVWGDILIADVTGLQAALDSKAPTGHTHANATPSESGFASAADKAKLDGIATGATANSTDAQLRDRSTHTGSQAISTVTGLQPALDDKATVAALAAEAAALATEAAARASADTTEASTRGAADTTLQTNITNEAAARSAADDTLQPLDSDLTAIAAIAPVNDDVIQRKSGAWVNRSIAQLKADFALVKNDVGLGNVDNTSDISKPVSTAQQTALDLKANLLSPALTGTPTAPTAAVDTSTTQLATTAYVAGQGYAKSVSPSFTTPTLGVASATSINNVVITTPATSATITIANGKTFTVNNTLTLAGTDGTTMTFPATSANIARTDAAQTFTGLQTFASADIPIIAPAANIVSVRNGTNAQAFNLFNTYTDASNYARGFMRFTGSAFEIGGDGLGTGLSTVASVNIIQSAASGNGITLTTRGSARWVVGGPGHITASNHNAYDFGNGVNADARNVYAGTSVGVNQGTITAATTAFNHTATWNNAGVTFTSQKFNITDTTSAVGSMFVDYQVGGVSRFSITKAGDVKLRGLQHVTGTRPTCDSSARGTIWYVAGGTGVADTHEICRKDAADAYAWVTLF